VYISENTNNNLVDSFSLRTQPGQQHWRRAETGFPGATAQVQREHTCFEIKPLAAPRTLCQRKRLTVGSRGTLEMASSGLRMDWCKAHRWGVTTKSLPTTSTAALALHTYKLTHTVHALYLHFAAYKSFTCRGCEFLYSA